MVHEMLRKYRVKLGWGSIPNRIWFMLCFFFISMLLLLLIVLCILYVYSPTFFLLSFCTVQAKYSSHCNGMVRTRLRVCVCYEISSRYRETDFWCGVAKLGRMTQVWICGKFHIKCSMRLSEAYMHFVCVYMCVCIYASSIGDF